MIVTNEQLQELAPLTTTEKPYIDREGDPQTRTTEVFLIHTDTIVKFRLPNRKRWKLQTPTGDFPPYMHIRVGSADVHNFNFEGGEKPRVNTDEEEYCVGSIEVKARVITSTGGRDVNVYIYVNIHPTNESEPTHELEIKATEESTGTSLSWTALNFRASTRIELLSLAD